MTDIDRMSPVAALTPDERERARSAFEQTPGILDGLVLKALGTIEHGEQLANAIVARVREVTP